MKWIDTLEGLPKDPTPLTDALASAIVVSYARPFTVSQATKDKRVIALKGVQPAPELAPAHLMVLKLRNKVIGHKDAVPAPGDVATPNIIFVKRDSSGFDLHTIIVIGIVPTLLTKLKSLCTFFVGHCELQLEPFIAQYGPEIMKQPEGVYEIAASEPPDPWLRKQIRPIQTR
jgi:hypothetical protein